MGVQSFLSVVSKMLKDRRATHILDGCSALLVSGSDLLKKKDWRETHILDKCSAILIIGSDLLED